MYKIGFLGAGVMAGAIITAARTNEAVSGVKAGEIAAFDADSTKLEKFAKIGVIAATSASQLFETCEIVLLGVKPQQYADILKNIPEFKCSALISIMAGVKSEKIRALTCKPVIRVMPNLPATVGKGATAVYIPSDANAYKEFILDLFKCCGLVTQVSEDKFDAVTSISGSGPAYVYLFAQYLAEAGIAGGLSETESKSLALATIEGAAAYASQTPDSLEDLVRKVCSPGGTTIEAVNQFNDNNLKGIIFSAVNACKNKSTLLSDKY
ncbi:MAG: pyrroline-5-carboxylate reductase [Christensenellaceae bacterium]|jgi:pyrroline-5-carboxylate reductase|nr:pyrroline-5-carboxylate reductase [Christensenellaceae bacterium]